MNRAVAVVSLVAVLSVAAAGCGGGGGTVIVNPPHDVSNPALELVGLWTGTFTDQFGDYTASLKIDADSTVPSDEPGVAFIAWGEESLGLTIEWGEFVETGPGRYEFEYDAYFDGAYRDTVTGEIEFVDDDVVVGEFETTSGTSGEVSFARNAAFLQADLAGLYEMEFSDADDRSVFYTGAIEIEPDGDVKPGPFSYLTDGQNVWPIADGYVTLVDPWTGWYEGELFFDAPEDTIAIGGYLGTDLFVFAGIFEDALGSGLFTFRPF